MDETIAISRGNFNGLTGGIVTLNMTGKVDVGYLGSDPHVFKVSEHLQICKIHGNLISNISSRIKNIYISPILIELIYVGSTDKFIET